MKTINYEITSKYPWYFEFHFDSRISTDMFAQNVGFPQFRISLDRIFVSKDRYKVFVMCNERDVDLFITILDFANIEFVTYACIRKSNGYARKSAESASSDTLST